jgi:FkbM family methyltransferase
MSLVSKARTFLFVARRSPLQAWDLIQVKLEARFGLALHRLSRRRRMTRRFELQRTQPLSADLVAYGNYYLDPGRIPDRPVAFSVGVGEDLAFDRELLDRHDVRLFLFDPTPRSRRFVERAGLPANAHFSAAAVADHDGTIELYIDDLEPGFDTTTSVSVIDKGLGGEAITLPCRRVVTLMAENGLDQLDILKLDIEGAAIAVLEDVLDCDILPTQIAAEFERPERVAEVRTYLRQLDTLFARLEALGYALFRTRPDYPGFQVEILAVRA